MKDAWYIDKGKQRCGPFTFEQFQRLTDSGLLLRNDMVRDEGAQKWVSASVVEGLFPPEAVPAVPPDGTPAEIPLLETPPAPTAGKEAAPATPYLPPPPRPMHAEGRAEPLAEDAGRTAAWQRLREIARCQRRLNLTPMPVVAAVLALILLSGLLERYPSLSGTLFTPLTAFTAWALFLAMLVGCRVLLSRATRELATALDLKGGTGLFSLWGVTQEANRRLRAANVRVGFLGATMPEYPPQSFHPSEGPLRFDQRPRIAEPAVHEAVIPAREGPEKKAGERPVDQRMVDVRNTAFQSTSPPTFIYYAKNGKRCGRLQFEQIRRFVDSGVLQADDMLVNEATGQSVSAQSVAGLFTALDAPSVLMSDVSAEPLIQAPPRRTEPFKAALPLPPQGRPSRSTRGFENILAILAILSIPLWLFNEVIGKPFLVVAGLIWVVVGVYAIFTGRTPSFTSQGTRHPVGYRIGGVLLALFGVSTLANMFTVVPGEGKPTAVEADRFVRQQMEEQMKRKVDSLQLRESPDGGYEGKAMIGSLTYDVRVEVKGRQMALQAKVHQDEAALGPIRAPDGCEGQADLPARRAKEFQKDEKAVLRYKGKKGKFALWLVPGLWKQEEPSNQFAEAQFAHKDDEAWATVIAERVQTPMSALKKAALENAKQGDKEAKIVKEEARVVNWSEVLCLEIEASTEGVPMTLYGYYYSGDQGTIQVLTWTSRNLFQELKPEMERFLNGFEIIQKGKEDDGRE
jgi:hypothetical protein